MSQSEVKLTQLQKAQIYCIKHGHADYISMCFGYVHCGRCNEQIGDTLAGVYDTSEKLVIGHQCEKCDLVKRTLSKLDLEILKKINDAGRFPDHEEVLKGIKFE